MASGAAAGLLVPVIHCMWFGGWSWPLQVFLRDWIMHLLAAYAAAIGTLLLLGFFQADTVPRRAMLRRLGVLTPMAVTLLHELGQSIWPHEHWEFWDTIRDALLDVAGAGLAGWLVRERVIIALSAPPAAPATHTELAPPALRR